VRKSNAAQHDLKDKKVADPSLEKRSVKDGAAQKVERLAGFHHSTMEMGCFASLAFKESTA
jgi:hypothetical protein